MNANDQYVGELTGSCAGVGRGGTAVISHYDLIIRNGNMQDHFQSNRKTGDEPELSLYSSWQLD